MRRFTLLFALIFFSISHAQLQPQSIIVNPSAGFGVDVYVNKDHTGNTVPTYVVGEPISISVRPNQDAYIYLFDINAYGQITQLLPNRLAGGQNNYVRAGQTRTFPAHHEGFDFTVEGPSGNDQIIALASRTPLNTNQLVQFRHDPFARGQGSIEVFAQTLSIIVQPVPVQSWVTDSVYINVTDHVVHHPTPSVPPVVVTPTPPVVPPILHPHHPVPSSQRLSSCANLYTPTGVTVSYLNDRPYSSDAIIHTGQDLRNIYTNLLNQLVAQGYAEYSYHVDFNARRLEASVIRGNELVEMVLDRNGSSQQVNFVLFCNY